MTIACLLLAGLTGSSAASEYFRINVVDSATGRGVPLVELRTTYDVKYYTDSNGVIAFFEPGLMDRDVYFYIRSHGYAPPPGGGHAFHATPGKEATLKLRRINIAERLYRITGEGIYRDSILLNLPVPVEQPLLNAQVTGLDSVLVAPYRGKLYWFYGDTQKLGGSLGNLATTGATSEWPASGGLDPALGVNLAYFARDSGFVKPMIDTVGPGLKWMYWVATLSDAAGREILVGRYRSKAANWKTLDGGLLVFHDEQQRFDRVAVLGSEADWLDKQVPMHPFAAAIAGKPYLYFPSPYPLLRAAPDLKSLADPSSYEAFTCLAPGTRYAKAATKLDRNSKGGLIWAWKRNTQAVGTSEQAEMLKLGLMKRHEAVLQLRAIDSDELITAHAGSVFWNAFRRRWIMIAQQGGSATNNGELWYAEADTPAGPWVYARKIITHEKYTFYNPGHHPFFDQEGGRIIYLQGTYTDFFSEAREKTPRYDYNQIMYRLALDDSRLFLPAPVYRTRDGRLLMRDEIDKEGLWDKIEAIPFFALPRDRRLKSSVEVASFYALPVTAPRNLTGEWRCTIKEEHFDFTLTLHHDGDVVEGAADELPVTAASLDNGLLTLRVGDGEKSYALTAHVTTNVISGKITELGEPGESACTCKRTTREDSLSPALVALYENSTANGGRTYSPVKLRASAKAVARVWRNPMTVLPLDRHVVFTGAGRADKLTAEAIGSAAFQK